MRVPALALTALAFALTPAAWAQSPDAGMAPGCGMVTPEGECVGNTVRYCDTMSMPNELVEYDCVMELGAGAICQSISVDYGVDCALPTGAECVYLDQNDELVALFCQGTGAGCVETATTSACVAGGMACADGDVGTCRGALAVIECNEGQGWFLDCATLGATCDMGVCVNAPEGALCDDRVECAMGLVCSADGECAPPPADAGVTVTDGGAAASDAGVTAGRDASTVGDATVLPRADARVTTEPTTTTDDGCTCVTPPREGAPGAALLMAAAMALVLVRRRPGR